MNERDLPRTHVAGHTRKRQAPRKRTAESNAATAATFALRVSEESTERQAQALCGVLRRWCDVGAALDVARRMVAILEGK